MGLNASPYGSARCRNDPGISGRWSGPLGSVGGCCGGSEGSEDLGFDGGGVERSGEEEALGLVDVFLSEVVHLFGGFNAFGESH